MEGKSSTDSLSCVCWQIAITSITESISLPAGVYWRTGELGDRSRNSQSAQSGDERSVAFSVLAKANRHQRPSARTACPTGHSIVDREFDLPSGCPHTQSSFTGMRDILRTKATLARTLDCAATWHLSWPRRARWNRQARVRGGRSISLARKNMRRRSPTRRALSISGSLPGKLTVLMRIASFFTSI